MKAALITGVNGQDGSYMAEHLLCRGYYVYGTVRGKNPVWPDGFDPGQRELMVLRLDLGQPDSIRRIWDNLLPIDECYNFAAQSHVGHSFTAPGETYAVTGLGACLLMDSYFEACPKGRFYQASTSEMFGGARDAGMHTLEDAFDPQSPYAVAKLMAHYNAMRLRAAGYFVISGVLFNHESERRHESFVTQKVAKYVAQRSRSLEKDLPKLRLGYIEACRDWGYAPEYMEAVYTAMQMDFPAVWLLGTGVSISVREMVKRAFDVVGLDWADYVEYDRSDCNRPQDVEYLCADPTDLRHLLGRTPVSVDQLIQRMVEHQLAKGG